MFPIAMAQQILSPIYREIPYESPEEVYSRLMSKDSFLFESVRGPEQTARFSFIGIDPYLIFKVKDGVIEIEFEGKKTISSNETPER